MTLGNETQSEEPCSTQSLEHRYGSEEMVSQSEHDPTICMIGVYIWITWWTRKTTMTSHMIRSRWWNQFNRSVGNNGDRWVRSSANQCIGTVRIECHVHGKLVSQRWPDHRKRGSKDWRQDWTPFGTNPYIVYLDHQTRAVSDQFGITWFVLPRMKREGSELDQGDPFECTKSDDLIFKPGKLETFTNRNENFVLPTRGHKSRYALKMTRHDVY